MVLIGAISDARQKVLLDLHRCLTNIQRLASRPFEAPDAGVAILRSIRSESYEDLNQIQHEHFILLARQWLLDNKTCQQDTEWWWNPRQTGTAEEPDLQGRHNGAVILSAEITTSAKPAGKIDTRMTWTLEKLSAMEGAQYYFVCSDSMRQRATTKVSSARWPIRVVMLPEGGDLL